MKTNKKEDALCLIAIGLIVTSFWMLSPCFGLATFGLFVLIVAVGSYELRKGR